VINRIGKKFSENENLFGILIIFLDITKSIIVLPSFMETNYILKAPKLIDILCDILREKEVPLQVVRLLFRLLWWKVLVFFAGGRECMTLVGYKGLTQGSVLSPILYNIIG
jgi:hypothetical protein